jgi:threonine/homoserine/homoserine lactone efflux protein
VKVLLTIGFLQLLAVISPGPSFLITARAAVANSRWQGVQVALGLGAGTVIWASAAVLGLHVLFEKFPALFFVMKLSGALFLLWIAFQIFRHAAEPLAIGDAGVEAERSPFWQGFFTQISNPKVVVFFGSIFIALLPHDVPLWMSLSLIAIVSFNEVWWYSAVSAFFGTPAVRRFYMAAKSWIDRVTGLFLGGLGLKLLWGAWEA